MWFIGGKIAPHLTGLLVIHHLLRVWANTYSYSNSMGDFARYVESLRTILFMIGARAFDFR